MIHFTEGKGLTELIILIIKIICQHLLFKGASSKADLWSLFCSSKCQAISQVKMICEV